MSLPDNPSPSKGAEVRARVTQETLEALARLATARGELVPVIVREAISEYLAKRVRPGAPPSQREAVLEALREEPAVMKALVDIAKMLNPPAHYGTEPSSATAAEAMHDLLDTGGAALLKNRAAESKHNAPVRAPERRARARSNVKSTSAKSKV